MKDTNQTNDNNIKNSDARGKSPLVITVFISITVMLITTVISSLFYVNTTKKITDESNQSGNVSYEQYYSLICENNEFNRQIYEYAKAKGDELNICVDMLSMRTSYEYSVEELFEIALESKVDGIIVESKDAQNMKVLIDKACSNGIDVVTLLCDSPDSMRRSSVQVSAYNLGKTYGQQVVSKEMKGNEKILVINDSSNSDVSQTLIFTGIQDTVLSSFGTTENTISVTQYSFDGSDTFAMEEDIRSIFLSEDAIPDVIICPDDQATEAVYQALVDYNKVGTVRLIGYHNSKTIIDGIRKGVIEASIVVDVKGLGEYAVEALSEYKATGFASEYYSVDAELIDIYSLKK